MFKKLLEMNEKVKNNINRFKKGVPEIDNLLDVIYEMELDQDDDDFVLYHKYNALVNSSSKKQFLPVEEFIELTNITTNVLTNGWLFRDFYNNQAGEIHNIIINNLIKNPYYKFNKEFFNEIYGKLLWNSRSPKMMNLLSDIFDTNNREINDLIRGFVSDNRYTIDTAQKYDPPQELLNLIDKNELEYPGFKKKFIDICSTTGLYKYCLEDTLKLDIKKRWENIRKQTVVSRDITHSYLKMIYVFTAPEDDHKMFSDERDLYRILFLLYDEDAAWKFLEEKVKDNLFMKYRDNITDYHKIELLLYELLGTPTRDYH